MIEKIKRIKVGFAPLIILILFTIGTCYILQSFYFYNIFEPRRKESREFLLNRTGENIDELTKFIRLTILNKLNGNNNQQLISDLEKSLKQLASQLEKIAITDRSSSLDNIFERFSMLVAIVTLIFGGFGIFATLQYRDQLKQLGEELKKIKYEYEGILNHTREQLERETSATNEKLKEAISKSMDMIWLVGNQLEQLLNLDLIENGNNKKKRRYNERAKQFLKDIYLTGFRFELHSDDEDERISALHNLYAQGTCEDLKDILRLYYSPDEGNQVKELAWRAVQNILDKCSHENKHSDLFLNR